jgi:hypothetical protein
MWEEAGEVKSTEAYITNMRLAIELSDGVTLV